MIGWAVVLLKKTTQYVDEPLLVLRVSEEIILLQCDIHVLCEGETVAPAFSAALLWCVMFFVDKFSKPSNTTMAFPYFLVT